MISRDLAEQSGQLVSLALAQRCGRVGLMRRADLARAPHDVFAFAGQPELVSAAIAGAAAPGDQPLLLQPVDQNADLQELARGQSVGNDPVVDSARAVPVSGTGPDAFAEDGPHPGIETQERLAAQVLEVLTTKE